MVKCAKLEIDETLYQIHGVKSLQNGRKVRVGKAWHTPFSGRVG